MGEGRMSIPAGRMGQPRVVRAVAIGHIDFDVPVTVGHEHDPRARPETMPDRCRWPTWQDITRRQQRCGQRSDSACIGAPFENALSRISRRSSRYLQSCLAKSITLPS